MEWLATGGHVPTMPQPCLVMGFAQIRSFFWGGGRGVGGDGGRTWLQTCVEKHLTAANCLYTGASPPDLHRGSAPGPCP